MAKKLSRDDPEGIEDGRLAVVPTMLAHWSALPTKADMPPVCTWPLTTEEGRAMLHQVIAGQSVVLWDECEREPYTFRVRHLAAHYGEYEPEDRPGELVAGPILSLIGDGVVYHTSSETCFRSLQQLALLEGAPPWEPMVILQAQRLPTRNRRVRLALTYHGRE